MLKNLKVFRKGINDVNNANLSSTTIQNERLIRVGCPAHNCGGRCMFVAHIKDGVIVRLSADDRPDGNLNALQLRACPRGRAYLRRQYHPDRLLYPMRRIGKRGEGRFQRLSWNDALDWMAGELIRIKEEYDNNAIFVHIGTGSYNQVGGSAVANRLMNLFGGSLGLWNNYSWASTNVATPTIYGTRFTGHQRLDWFNSKYILMWGWNPCEMRDGTNTEYFLKLVRKNGTRIICIDPRLSPSAISLADEWIPIRPGTDVAMMSAMAYVIISEKLYDANFVHTYCIGFDSTQMPSGYADAESYCDYILGTRDGIPKTPEWAEPITGVPSQTISRIAREYATIKPSMLYQGYGMQRRAYGEQVVRAGCTLASITGNVGISGGWASGLGLQSSGGPAWNLFPIGENPIKAMIPIFLWTEAIARGPELTKEDGIKGADKLKHNIKLIYAVATNTLINQHANINRTTKLLGDESLVEFIAVQDQFLTPTARFADLVLPVCTQFETWGLEDGWKFGEEIILMPKLVEPPGEAKSDYQICVELAQRLGLGEKFTEGRDEKGWVEWILSKYRETRYQDLPTLEEFLATNQGVYVPPPRPINPAFDDFRADPQTHPLDTSSGKIEIFSEDLFTLHRPDEIPAIPKYIQEWESPFGPEAKKHPLQAIGHHSLRRAHSTHDNVDWLEEAFPHRVSINPFDAKVRNIKDGDEVMVFNSRGAMRLKCRVTVKMMPGVVDIPEGAWWTPDNKFIDRRGAINVLTSERWTPLACGNTQHTIMVEVKKAEKE